MRNIHAGKCNKCGVHVDVKQGRWRLIPKQVQNFTGLRCMKCSTTTNKNKKQNNENKNNKST